MYSLYALLGRSDALVDRSLELPSAVLVHLESGVGMIPFTETLIDEMRERDGRRSVASVAPFEFLTPSAAEWARRISRDTVTAYVEVEYIAGEGTESAMVWREGAVAEGPFSGVGSVRRALRAIGVVTSGDEDEFELVGLGRCRTPSEWLADFD